ncbi:ABC transporter permease subunit [Cellulomonas cellasea]|uniref:ABC-2 type transport system permease protein n=1 Tax=Cellulomonas cellasea TaxID=43670 RepID=A0A7W4UHQ8_9CELL|nr:ABC transporter permease subunit [Cellulomonas cellasea]MBB2923930.1 ABC-2 type transport system permease protein [Cellulomonas cellasea]
MSTLTKPATATPPAPPRAVRARLSFPHLVRSEWIKLWTVRSTYWILPLTIIAFVGVAWMTAHFTSSEAAQSDGAPVVDASIIVQSGMYLAQLALVVLAVLTVTGEYSTGMIRATFAAAPTRLPVLWAKALVLAVVTFVTGVVAIAITYLVTTWVLGSDDAIDLANAENQRILLGAVLYMTAIALFAFALGALMRHSAAALATVLGLLVVVQLVFQAVPAQFFRTVSPFLPGTAGSQIMQSEMFLEMQRQIPNSPFLTPWQGFGVLLAWTAVFLVAAMVLVRRRDA